MVIGEFLSQRASTKLSCLLYCYSEQSVAQTVELPMIRDAIMPIWRYCNKSDLKLQFRGNFSTCCQTNLLLSLIFSMFQKETCVIVRRAGLMDRNKILRGGELSHLHVPDCTWVFFYFLWFVFIHHNFQFYFKLYTYCNILDIYLS